MRVCNELHSIILSKTENEENIPAVSKVRHANSKTAAGLFKDQHTILHKDMLLIMADQPDETQASQRPRGSTSEGARSNGEGWNRMACQELQPQYVGSVKMSFAEFLKHVR